MNEEDRKNQRIDALLRPRVQFPRSPDELFGMRTNVESLRKVLVAATECFAEHGYHGSSTRDIAERATMSPAAMYMHFNTKEQVLFTVIKIISEWVTEELENTAKNFADPRQRLGALVKLHVICHAVMRQTLRVATSEFRYLSAKNQKLIAKYADKIESLFYKSLLEGYKAKYFDIADPHLMCTSILALCTSVPRWYSDSGKLTAEALGDRYAQIVFRMVGADVDTHLISRH